MIQLAVEFLAFHLDVGKGRHAARTPVDHPISPIKEPLFVKLHEHVADRLGQSFVHGEPLAGPVAGCSQPLQLVQDDASVLLPPRPNAFQEGFTPQSIPGESLLGELPLHHVLGGDAGMVCSGYP